FLYKIKVKPFLELSFMPELLAKNRHTVFSNRPSFVSMPGNTSRWSFLIKGFLLHCMERYGKKEVEAWLFEFWNEPDMTEMFWYDSVEDYFAFYDSTYKTVKSISEKLLIGGPAVCNLSNIEELLQRYFEYCKTMDCLPDFFTFHNYLHNASLDEIHNSYYSGNKRITLSNDSDYLKKCIEHITRLIAEYNYNPGNIHMTEWNASPSHRDLSRDTLFMASYIVKNILENMDLVSSFGYWTITDYIEEFPLPKECFHGGLGVITANGIKKAGYHAFTFLKRLGTDKISSGPGYYITSDANGYQVLLYNYCHYDPLYCSMDHSGITYTDRYKIYRDNVDKTIQLTLKGFNEATYRITEQTVNQSHGSSFDAWVDMGCPENMTQENIEYLRSKAVPLYHEAVVVIKDTYLLQRCLTPHEIRMIEITEL
ncbi:MAG TPA: hypothetical protein VN131_02475, partial [Mobilitalea sp.]|nr:hypothetical protein [Mobilitalea sp.]